MRGGRSRPSDCIRPPNESLELTRPHTASIPQQRSSPATLQLNSSVRLHRWQRSNRTLGGPKKCRVFPYISSCDCNKAESIHLASLVMSRHQGTPATNV